VTHSQLQQFPPKIAHDFVIAYSQALTPLYVYLVPIIAAGFVLAFFLAEKPLSTTLGRRSGGGQGPDGPQQDTQQPSPEPSAGASAGDGNRPALTGSVQRAGQRVAAAKLVLTDHSGVRYGETRSAADGSYRLEPPGSGTYLLTTSTSENGDSEQVAEIIVDGGGGDVVRDVQLAREAS
jgi:hypothetical protein